MKKLITTLLSLLMIALCVMGIAACNNENNGNQSGEYKYSISIWVGEDTKALTEQLITKFNQENGKGITINASVKEVSESVAAGDVLAKPADAPEMFCFVQNQIAALVYSKLLAAPSNSAVTNIKATHTESAVNAATVGNTVYAYPLTEDNGYLLYYDKEVFDTPDKVATIENIVATCEAQNKYFSFNLSGGWYAASFFYAKDADGKSLCQSEWTVDDKGRFTAYDDTFDTANGKIAAKALQKVLQSKRYLDSGKASDFKGGTPAAAVVSGIWDYQTAKSKLGDNLGIAPLPSFTGTDGKSYTLQSYLGCKLVGITPQTDDMKMAALQLLAQYLTNEQSQLARFEALGWGPSVKTAANSDAVKSNVALNILKQTATINQGQYHESWWAKAQALSNSIKAAETDSALELALSRYSGSLDELLG